METQPETGHETKVEEVLQQKSSSSDDIGTTTTNTTAATTSATARPPPSLLKRFPGPPPQTPSTSGGNSSSMTLNEVRAAVEGSVAAHPVKLIAGRHALVRAKREETDREIAEKKEQVKLLERELALAEGSLRIMSGKVRGLKEKYFHAKNTLVDKENSHEVLVKELVQVQCRTKLAEDKYKVLETKYVDFQVEKIVRIDQINEMEENMGDKEFKEEVDQLKDTVKQYSEYRDGLERGDSDLVRLQSGETLVEMETRKNGIRDAFTKREARAEAIYMEIDEKNEAVDKLKQELLIKEKQNQARLRKLQRELEDKESTENHLKQTVEYLGRQIDPAVSKGVGGGSTMNKNTTSGQAGGFTFYAKK